MTSGTAAQTSRAGTGAAPHSALGPAALSLPADAANKQPLLCVIDDAQWEEMRSGGGAFTGGPTA
jgi:hypothetical protein